MLKQRKLIIMSLFGFFLVGCGGEEASFSDESKDGPPSMSEPSQSSESSEVISPTYNNPVWEPILADPAIIRGDDGIFYAYGTQDNAAWDDYFGVSFIPILSSPDLVNWKYEKSVFQMYNAPYWGTNGAGLWAPDIVKIGDKYNLYYSLSIWGDPNPGIGVATASSPLGPFTDHGKVVDSLTSNVGNSIDPAVNVTDDGRVYLTWGSFRGIYIVELTSDGLRVKNDDPTARKLLAGYDGGAWNGASYEGAYIRKINTFYYLFLSTGTCCDGLNSTYKVVVARSENITGPYVDHTGVDMAGHVSMGSLVVDRNERFVGVGHNSLIEDDAGDIWIVYHGYDTHENPLYGTTNRRSLLIDKLLWDEDGWPYVAGYGPSTISDKPFIQH